MKWYRRLLILGLALALTVGTSCTSGEPLLGTEIQGDGPSGDGGALPPEEVPPGDEPPADEPPVDEPPADEPPADEPPADEPPGDGDVPPHSDLLRCEPQPYATATAVVGPNGGQISVGAHSLTILENALSEDVTIRAEQIDGEVNSVRFSPEGLHFAVPAVLTMTYGNCANVEQAKRIVFTDEALNILESLPSLDLKGSSEVQTLIDHFSRYAVAY
jgi:hypothetical protein